MQLETADGDTAVQPMVINLITIDSVSQDVLRIITPIITSHAATVAGSR